MSRRIALAAAILVAGGPESVAAESQPSPAELLPKLAASSQRFETMLKKVTFTMEGHIETVGRDGAATEKREGLFIVRGDGKRRHVDVLRYTEDGENKTEDAREKVHEDEQKPPQEDAHMPFLPSEQPKYTFRMRETDSRDAARVRIEFSPKHPEKNLFVGSAWVDTRTGDVLTMGVSPSKTSLFVDYLRVRIEFGERVADTIAVSRITFEGSGGFLLFHRRFQGEAKLWKYHG